VIFLVLKAVIPPARAAQIPADSPLALLFYLSPFWIGVTVYLILGSIERRAKISVTLGQERVGRAKWSVSDCGRTVEASRRTVMELLEGGQAGK
jgi:hypothetical protein